MIEYLRHMAIFSRVAEEGSFSKAAQSLGIAPSRVSESVSKLENYVGVTLFNRTTRKVALTSEGRRFYKHTSGILAGAERGINDLRESKSVLTGALRISVPTYLSSSRLARAIGKFISLHSQVNVTADFTDDSVDPVQDGYDMCIRSGQFDKRGGTSRKLGSLERAIFVGPNYLSSRINANHPRDLSKWDWINYRHGKRSYSLKSDSGEAIKLTIQDQARLQVDNIDALYSFACMDFGVAVMPLEYALQGVQESKLIRLFDNWHLPKVHCFAAWPDKSLRESLISTFVDFLSDDLQGENHQ